ncbi:MAG: outer membrane protein transport protein [Elusimicrobiota bacterium]|nr:outer membrane protein transport protein [Elusimicrobiota bacterium]
MKKLFAVCLFFAVAGHLDAKGIFTNPGTRAASLGGAYTGIADDLTAIYWNPAGLAQLEGSGSEVSLVYSASPAKANTAPTNDGSPDSTNGSFPIPESAFSGGEPDFNERELDIKAVLPFAGIYENRNGFVRAFGVYASGGGGGIWEDGSVPNLYASLSSKYAYIVTNFTVAKKISNRLSVGGGLNIVNMFDKLFVEKKWSGGAPYTATIDKNSYGYGFEITAGAMYELNSRLQLGAVIRSGAKIKLDGSATVTHSIPAYAAALGGVSEYTQEYHYPMTAGVGASYNVNKKMLVTGGIDFNRYSRMKDDTTYDTPSGILTSGSNNDGWVNTYQIRGGVEYAASGRLAYRFGFYTDPAPNDRSKLTLFNTNQYDWIPVTLGVGYDFGRTKIDFCYAHTFSDQPSSGTREYEYAVDSVRFSTAYKF